MRGWFLAAALALLAGCPNGSLTSCDAEPDITGRWTLTLVPARMGGPPRGDTVIADLQQMPRPNSALGSLVWGTLTSNDKGFFDTLTIPQLVNNNGGKTGGIVGCQLKINVPISTMVTDDNVDNGPLRIALSGTVSARGHLTGDVSTVIRADNPAMMQEMVTWSGVQQ